MKIVRSLFSLFLALLLLTGCANSDLVVQVLSPKIGSELLINESQLLQISIKTENSESGQLFVGLQRKTKDSWELATRIKKVLAPGKSEIKFTAKTVGSQKYRYAVWIDEDTSNAPIAVSANTSSVVYDITAERQRIWEYSLAFSASYGDYQTIKETCFDENNSGNYYSFVNCLSELKTSYKKLSKSAATLANKLETVNVPEELSALYRIQRSDILLISDNLNYIIQTYCFSGVENDANIELLYACIGTDPSIGDKNWNEIFDAIKHLGELRSEIIAYLESKGLVFDLTAK